MTTIPLIPLRDHPAPIDPDRDTVSIDTSDGVVVTTYRLRNACYVTITYPGPPCQSWAVAAPLPDTAAAAHYAALLVGGAVSLRHPDNPEVKAKPLWPFEPATSRKSRLPTVLHTTGVR